MSLGVGSLLCPSSRSLALPRPHGTHPHELLAYAHPVARLAGIFDVTGDHAFVRRLLDDLRLRADHRQCTWQEKKQRHRAHHRIEEQYEVQAAVAEAETALEQARAAKDATAIEAAQNALVENEEALSRANKVMETPFGNSLFLYLIS